MGFTCISLEENEYGEMVCRYDGCPCPHTSRDQCIYSDTYEKRSYRLFED